MPHLSKVGPLGPPTVNIVLDGIVAALGGRSWGERVGLPSNEERVCRTQCMRYIP